MPILIPEGYAQVILRSIPAGNNNDCWTTWGLQVDLNDPPSSGDLTTFADALIEAWSYLIGPNGNVGPVKFIAGTPGPANFEFTTGTIISGNASSNVVNPPQVQAILAKRSGLAARWARGRTFVPDCPDAQILDDGSINSAYLATLQDFCDTFTTLCDGTHFLGHYILHDSTSPATEPTTVVSYQPAAKVGTLRARFHR